MIKYFLTITFICAFIGASIAQKKKTNASGKLTKENILNKLDNERKIVQVHLDSVMLASNSDAEFSDQDVIIGHRIQRLQRTIPLEYNLRVKAYLDKYISRNYKPYMEKLLGLSDYYFPIYERIFAETGIPDEVKFLSVVESSLDPHTLSTSGAVGPWQFIYGTAKIYDLSMSQYMDERKDVISSTYAVSRYLNEAYTEFNDWLLALASYNCGRGCVRRAIQKSGITQPTFWELSPYLPQETRNYIPKYIAMTYALSNAETYDLNAKDTDLQLDYKIVMVDRNVDLSNIANAVGHTLDVLKQFNPAYKRNFVNGSIEAPKRLYIPYDRHTNDSLLYLALNSSHQIDNQNIAQIRHKVKSGETLVSISKRYGVSVGALLASNELHARSSIAGKTLLVENHSTDNTPTNKTLLSNVEKVKKTTTKSNYLVYVVKKGDTLSGIASKHKGSDVSKIKADNQIKGSHLSVGQKIKIHTR